MPAGRGREPWPSTRSSTERARTWSVCGRWHNKRRMRIAVPLRRAYKLINHGPTTLITTAHGDRRNVMTAAWVMAIDYDPAKIVAVIAADTLTRRLVEASGEFV